MLSVTSMLALTTTRESWLDSVRMRRETQWHSFKRIGRQRMIHHTSRIGWYQVTIHCLPVDWYKSFLVEPANLYQDCMPSIRRWLIKGWHHQ